MYQVRFGVSALCHPFAVTVFVFSLCGMADNGHAQAVELLSAAEQARYNRAAAMAADRKRLKREQQELTRQIRNEQRKRQRLIEKARALSETDLATILGARAAARAKAKPKAKARVN